MPKFHMKKDQSGAALCHAVERNCPNGEFGHYESEYEVYMAYEYAVAEGKLPGLSTLVSLKRDEIAQQRLAMAAELAKVKTDEDYANAIAWNIHPLDASEQLKLLELHSGASERDLAVRSRIANLTNCSNVLEQLASEESDEEIASTALDNKHMSDGDAQYIASRFKDSSLVKTSVSIRDKRSAHRNEGAAPAKQTPAAKPQHVPLPPASAAQSTQAPRAQPSAAPRETAAPAANRPARELINSMAEAVENFEGKFQHVDKGLSTLAKQLRENGNGELASALNSRRIYNRALLPGGITIAGETKSCLTHCTVKFEKPLGEQNARMLAPKLQEMIAKELPGYTVTVSNSELKVSPLSDSEMNNFRKAFAALS